MFTSSPTVGPRAAVAPAPGALASPLQGILVALLASSVALRQLDWWKLFERVGHLPTRRGQLLVHCTAIGLTFTGTDACEEVAEEEETPLSSALRHALLRVALEAVLFYALLSIAALCGLSDADNGEHESDLLAYLADAIVGGWGEPFVHALSCVLFIAACEIARRLFVEQTCDVRRRGEPCVRPPSFEEAANTRFAATRTDRARHRATTAHAPQTTRASTIAAYSLPMNRSNRVVCDGSADSS
jgi:hypothetical protein